MYRSRGKSRRKSSDKTNNKATDSESEQRAGRVFRTLLCALNRQSLHYGDRGLDHGDEGTGSDGRKRALINSAGFAVHAFVTDGEVTSSVTGTRAKRFRVIRTRDHRGRRLRSAVPARGEWCFGENRTIVVACAIGVKTKKKIDEDIT